VVFAPKGTTFGGIVARDSRRSGRLEPRNCESLMVSGLDRRMLRTADVGSCPVCSSDGSEGVFCSADFLHAVPGEFTYRRCKSCGTVFQDPRVVPNDLALCYPSGYYTHVATSETAEAQVGRVTGRRRFGVLRDGLRAGIVSTVQRGLHRGCQSVALAWLARSRKLRERAFLGVIDELIPRRVPAGRALDIGCGAGFLMRDLARVGWAVEGFEWDAAAAEVASRTSRHAVSVGDFRTTALPRSAFDLVVLNHVFEHLDDPVLALRRIAQILAPGGHAVLIYPNPESVGARLFGVSWVGWDPPRHLVIPPPRAIRIAALRAGLKVVRTRTLTRDYGGYSYSWGQCQAGRPTSGGARRIKEKLLGRVSTASFLRKLAVFWRLCGLEMGEEVVVTLAQEGHKMASQGYSG